MKVLMRKIGFVVCLVFAAIFGFAYYEQYFKWRSCFNDLGRCYGSEAGVVYLEQSGIIWLSLVVIATAVGFYQLWRLRAGKP